MVALVVPLLVGGVLVASAGPALAVVGCGGAAQNGLTITPAHDTTFYADLGSSFDAAYLGYQITNSGASRTNLWVTVGSFAGGSVTLADATAQTHTVTVYDRRPDLTGATALATCQFSFTSVTGAIEANANKVTGTSTPVRTPSNPRPAPNSTSSPPS